LEEFKNFVKNKAANFFVALNNRERNVSWSILFSTFHVLHPLIDQKQKKKNIEDIMKKILLLATASLTFLSCERQDREVRQDRDQAVMTTEDADNSGRNVRDRNSDTKTPFDQSESEIDRKITQQIRRALVADPVLSINAKNIKVITINGVVTLRGPVANAQEKEIIVRKIGEIKGISKVDNQLEITHNP
jgi:hyperosmotically inducible periplasmic protein